MEIDIDEIVADSGARRVQDVHAMGATLVPMFQRGAKSRRNIGFPLGIARSLPCAKCLRGGIIFAQALQRAHGTAV
ncbi:hypothetical protein D7S81_20510 [Ralstonia insidiosa]|jgi:hypothetical protein|nr:hypothetical protein [Ralstonia insidiosa]